MHTTPQRLRVARAPVVVNTDFFSTQASRCRDRGRKEGVRATRVGCKPSLYSR